MRVRASVALVALLIAGCGDGDGGDDVGDAQPAPDVQTFQDGDFGEIPLPPLAEEAGERSEEDGVVAQSFFVRNRTPQEILEFYEAELAALDAQVVSSPAASGDAWRGTWLVGDRELLVSAIPAPTVEGAEVEHAEVVSQLSLELSPAGGGGHDGAG